VNWIFQPNIKSLHILPGGFSVESLQAQSLLNQMLTVNMFYHQNYACCVGLCYPSTSYMNEYIYIIYLYIGIYIYVYIHMYRDLGAC
jgi:hypothetical protein